MRTGRRCRRTAAIALVSGVLATGTPVMPAVAAGGPVLGAVAPGRAGVATRQALTDAVVITPADRKAAGTATTTFRSATAAATSAFLGDTRRLRTDLDAGAIGPAETDDLAARAAYDHIRQLEEGDTGAVVAASLDGTPGQSGPGESEGALPTIEHDLWSPVGPAGAGVADAAQVAAGLVAQASVARYLVDRVSLPPEAIGTTGVEELDWVLSVALRGQAEPFSHRDAVDVVATVDAADQAFGAIEPLARRLDPGAAAVTAARFAHLVAALRLLGDPDGLSLTAIPVATDRLLSARINGAASALAGLASELAPLGIRSGTS